MVLPKTIQLASIVLLSAVAGVINAIAGGGTLLTFPALVGLGVPPLVANATSTVALWPGVVSSMWGYRDELSGSTRWAVGFAIPSLIGGGIGAWLLLRTSPAEFSAIVPWLVFGATMLFIAQPAIIRTIQRRRATEIAEHKQPDGADRTASGQFPSTAVMFSQLLVGVYGGYFGAGVGIFTLAVLGFIGLTNIHRMNGLKNWSGLCMNAVASLMFVFSSLVAWPIALSMAVGSIGGGYFGARAAQRTPQHYVRRAVIAIGLLGWLWLLLKSR